MLRKILTLEQAGEIVGIARATLRYYAEGKRKPQLEATLMGKTWITTPEALEAWKIAYNAAPKLGRRKPLPEKPK